MNTDCIEFLFHSFSNPKVVTDAMFLLLHLNKFDSIIAISHFAYHKKIRYPIETTIWLPYGLHLSLKRSILYINNRTACPHMAVHRNLLRKEDIRYERNISYCQRRLL